MSISENKTRTALTIDKQLKQELEAMAKEENRSFNNLVINILVEYIKQKKRDAE